MPEALAEPPESIAPEESESGPDRRSLMKAAALIAVPVVGVGAVAAACGSGTSTKAGGSAAGSGGSAGGPVAVPVASVPVDGGFIDKAANIVVTQPAAGTYKAFTAICTHLGCTVTTVVNNVITCPCHGSTYSATDGSVLGGPAPSPLTAMKATVNGANIDVAAV